MIWIQLSIYDGVSAYADKVLNLDAYKLIEPHSSGAQTKFIERNAGVELIADVPFATVARQIKEITGGYDIAGAPM